MILDDFRRSVAIRLRERDVAATAESLAMERRRLDGKVAMITGASRRPSRRTSRARSFISHREHQIT